MNSNPPSYHLPFFIVGGTLPRDARSYVARQADRLLIESLCRGEFCYVLTPRQMGKSSLMVRAAARLRVEGRAVAVIDLTALGQNLTAEQWYRGMLDRLAQQMALEDEIEAFWEAHRRLSPMQRWMAAIRDVVLQQQPNQVIIFIDEIDMVRSLPFSTDEFFAAIRECYNRRTQDPLFYRLTFCLLGVATPADLIRDTRMTPFNIGTRIELHDFTEAEALPLAKGLGRTQEMRVALLRRVLYWTNGHPYLTQRLCLAIAEDAEVTSAKEVDRVCKGLFLTAQAREQDDNLLFVRDRLLHGEGDVANRLDLYTHVLQGKRVFDDAGSAAISALRLSGIVQVVDGYLRVRNRIYAKAFDRAWVQKNMPRAEIHRQQRAFRRGMLRAASFSSTILATLGYLTLQTMHSVREARMAQRHTRAALEILQQEKEATNRHLFVANLNLAQRAYEEGNIQRALELLNICRQSTADANYTRFEWRYVWKLCHGELHTFCGHTEPLYSVALSPDGRWVATGSADYRVKVWDAATGRERWTFPGHTAEVHAVVFSRDGRILITGSADATVKLWDIASGCQVRTLHNGSGMFALALSPNGRILVTGNADKSIRVWDWKKGRLLRTLRGNETAIYAVAISSDNRTVVTGDFGGGVKLWDIHSGRKIRTLQREGAKPTPVAFSPNGRWVAAVAIDKSIQLWDTGTGRTIRRLKGHSHAVSSLATSPDGRWLASAGVDQIVRIWNVTTGQEAWRIRGHTRFVRSVAFSGNGRTLVTGSDDGTAKIWALPEGKKGWELSASTGPVVSAAISPDGKRVAMGTAGGIIWLWDVAKGTDMGTLPGRQKPLWAAAFDNSGRTLATGHVDGTIVLWDVERRRAQRVLRGHQGIIWDLAFSPDGRLLATGSADGTARLWDVATGRMIRILQTGQTTIVVFSFSNATLATGSVDGDVKLWNVKTGHERLSVQAHSKAVSSIAFSPDDRLLATAGGDQKIKLWEVSTGQNKFAFTAHAGTVNSVAFSPDGRTLASGGGDGKVRLWDVYSGRQMGTLAAPNRELNVVSFTPDGNALLAVFVEGTVYQWRAASVSEIEAVLHSPQLTERGR